MDPMQDRFVHRKNKDGTFDSICAVCFRTAGSRTAESELAEIERDHVCEGSFIQRSESQRDE